MKQNERFALKQYLYDFPDCGKLNDVIDMLYDADPRVKIQEPFLEFSTDSLVLAIKKTEHEIESQFFPVIELVTVIDKETVSHILSEILKRIPTDDEVEKISNRLDSLFSNQLHMAIVSTVELLGIKK